MTMSTPNPSAGTSAPVQSVSSPSPLRLMREQALVLCVDVQERLSAAIPAELLGRLRKNAAILLRGAAVLGVPVLVSEQYKKGLGDTLPDLVEALPAGSGAASRSSSSRPGRRRRLPRRSSAAVAPR